MNINLLKEGYKTDPGFYESFLNDRLEEDGYLSDDTVFIDEAPDFPIYFGQSKKEVKEQGLREMVKQLREHFIHLDKDIYMDERFWHSYLCVEKRKEILDRYPEIKEDEQAFHRIILRDFDWENYLYKGLLIALYVEEYGKTLSSDEYYELIFENMDLFNYIIKYPIFRNGQFLIHVMEIVKDNNLSKILKAKIKDRPDLGKDERYGRRVIYEFNKAYPVLLAPMLKKEDLEREFLNKLAIYYSGDEVEEVEEDWN